MSASIHSVPPQHKVLEAQVCSICQAVHLGEAGCEELEPRAGDRLGAYYLQELVGQGGMGRVFRAVHEKLGRTVAIKLMRRSVSVGEGGRRFLREARAVNKVRHPHLVEITDIVESPPGGDSYYVMEWLEGKSLHARHVECNGHMSLAEVLRVTIDVTEALGAAHEAGLIHRDLKPENIFLLQRGGRSDFAKVLDFGVAKDLHDPDSELDDYIVGTPAYIAPEQAEGRAGDGRSDIYSLGVVLYELTTGQLPYEAHTVEETLSLHLKADLLRPRKVAGRGGEIPKELEHIVLRCMQADPAQRYGTMEELRVDLLALRDRASVPGWRIDRRLSAWRPRMGPLLQGLRRLRPLALPASLCVAMLVVCSLYGGTIYDRARLVSDGILHPGASQQQGATEVDPLSSAPLPLQVEVRTTPSGAEVRYGGAVLGTTPCVVRLPEGKRDIELRRPGFRKEKRTVEVRLGLRVSVKLVPQR